MTPPSLFQQENDILEQCEPFLVTGQVTQVVGLIVEALGLRAPVGALCQIDTAEGPAEAEVVGFRDGRMLLIPYKPVRGLEPGARVQVLELKQTVGVCDEMLGRVLSGSGTPIDSGPDLIPTHRLPLFASAPPALSRSKIHEPLSTGIRAIDAFLTCGRGQRLGIFAGSGVGKSVLLGMMCRHTSAPIVIVGLVGERGREVREFIERDLGDEGMARAVIVVATADESPMERVKAAFCATTIAEYFRNQGEDVLLLIDSITRIAFAQREIGLSAGEPPATRGYPPSVFNLFPQLLERSGRGAIGSITAFYTVLVEGDDIADPIADTTRSILDGHIWLSRKLSSRSHYPAIDPLESISRSMIDVVDDSHLKASRSLVQLLSQYQESEDLVSVGAYVRGTNPLLDKALELRPEILEFLQQDRFEKSTFEDTQTWLHGLHQKTLPAQSQRPGGGS